MDVAEFIDLGLLSGKDDHRLSRTLEHCRPQQTCARAEKLAVIDVRLVQAILGEIDEPRGFTARLGPAGSRMPNTAKLAYTLGLRYAFDLANHPSYAGLNLRRVGQRNAGFDAAGSSVPNFSQPAYTLVDAHFAWTFHDDGRSQWEAFVDGNNLTNQTARPATSLFKDVAPLPGRNVSVGVRAYF